MHSTPAILAMVRWQTEMGRTLEACGPASLAYTLKFQTIRLFETKRLSSDLLVYIHEPSSTQTHTVGASQGTVH